MQVFLGLAIVHSISSGIHLLKLILWILNWQTYFLWSEFADPRWAHQLQWSWLKWSHSNAQFALCNSNSPISSSWSHFLFQIDAFGTRLPCQLPLSLGAACCWIPSLGALASACTGRAPRSYCLTPIAFHQEKHQVLQLITSNRGSPDPLPKDPSYSWQYHFEE